MARGTVTALLLAGVFHILLLLLRRSSNRENPDQAGAPEEPHRPGSEAWRQMPAADPAVLLDYYKHQADHAASNEQVVVEITKYNFAAFGAVFLAAGSFISQVLTPRIALDLACVIAGTVSLAASVMIVFYHKYVVVAYAKAKVIQKALVRQRSLPYLEWKVDDEDLPERFRAAMKLNALEFLRYGYVVQWINLITLIVSAGLFAAAHVGWLTIPDAFQKAL